VLPRSVLQLLVTGNVPSLRSLINLMIEAIHFPKRRFSEELGKQFMLCQE
jgi:hypothetical protein